MMCVQRTSVYTIAIIALGTTILTAIAPATLEADGTFKSKFQRRVVGDLKVSSTPLTGDVDADFTPGGNSPIPRSAHGTNSNKGKPTNHSKPEVDLSKEPTTNAEKAAVLDALIRQQERNIRLMEKELADAKREKRNPDPKKLKQYANATGDRTAAYNGKSKYVKDQIDRFEKEAPNTAHAALLAASILKGKFWQTHYKIEIDRSRRFIKQLQEEKRKL